jgi:hypothetical protein
MKTFIAKSSLTLSLAMTALHYVGNGVVAVEEYASKTIDSKYTNTIAGLAQDMGFIKPVVLEPKTRNKIIAREIAVNQISPTYASVYAGLIHHESGGNANAKSHQGAIGLGQVLGSNAKYCGFTEQDLYNEEKNIICGVRIFSEGLKRNNYNLVEALKEYHGGPDRKKWGSKTSAYPNLVLTALSKVK